MAFRRVKMGPQSSCGRNRSGFLPDRTVHLHPLSRCNLACSHCYSASSPEGSALLDPQRILTALPRLRAEGYEVISLSGGEPLLYPALAEFCAEARHLGFRLSAISNGFKVRASNAAVLDGLDALAISFDGMEAEHLAMRRHPRAWSAAMQALETLRDMGKPAAAAFTVSHNSLSDVPEFVEFAAGLGVRAVQLRPLVAAGRAVGGADAACLNEGEQRRLWLMAQTLGLAYEGEVAVHVDLAPAAALVADAGAWAGLLAATTGSSLSDQVNPLVITPEGLMKPFTYDFPPAFDLGPIEVLETGVAGATLRALAAVTQDALVRLDGQEGFIDWFAHVRDVAKEGMVQPV